MQDFVCWNCGTALEQLLHPISRRAHCPSCFTEVHCCRMCVHFDPSIRPEQCDEDQAEHPLNKETANFCDYFKPCPNAFDQAQNPREGQSRAQLEALFGETSSTAEDTDTDVSSNTDESAVSKEDAAKARLEALFKPPPQDNDHRE